MKVFELIFNDDSKGVFRVSLVKDPAVETTLVKFSKEESEKPLFFANEEKRIIYSVAMRPMKYIYRHNISSDKNNPEPGLVYYTAETIEKLQQNYFKNNNNKESNIKHEENNTDGIFPFESWIVSDPKSDKSLSMGLETVKGDWVMAFKIENEEVWRQCKEGKLDGLSIEAHLGLKQSSINFKSETKMNKAEKLLAMLTAFFSGETEAKEVAPGIFAVSTDVGSIVYDKDGKPMENTEFEIDGKKMKTNEKGEILEPEVEVEATEDEPSVEDLKSEIADLKSQVSTLEAEKLKWEGEKTKSESELQKMKSEKEKADLEVVKMTAQIADYKKTPATIKIPTTPIEMAQDIPYEQMTPFQQMKFNKEKRG